MREAGRLVGRVVETLATAVRPGVTTAELDAIAERLIREGGGIPAFKGYQGFPAAICASLNDEVVHGIPGPRRLVEGDILGIDVGAVLGGYVGDGAFTFKVGAVSREADRLLAVTSEALVAGIAEARPGRRLTVISHAIQTVVEGAGFSVVRSYCGHGIGREMHEDPQVPNFGPPGRGPKLEAGMVLAIEPMVNAGGYEVDVDPDGWTVRTADNTLSAHFEHTVAVTIDGPVILTAP